MGKPLRFEADMTGGVYLVVFGQIIYFPIDVGVVGNLKLVYRLRSFSSPFQMLAGRLSCLAVAQQILPTQKGAWGTERNKNRQKGETR